MRKRLLSFLLLLPLISSLSAQTKLTDQQVKQRVEKLLSQMTLEEKIGQMNQIPGGFVTGPEKPEDLIRKGLGGSVLWINDPVVMNRFQHIAVEQTRLHIPILFGLDVIHGYRTIFPIPLAMAASWDPKMAEAAQAVAAKEARADGFAWTFAPMVDIARDPRWGRILEGAGEDPFLGAAMARAQVRGFQGEDNDLSNPDHVLACVKHFAGYGAADGGRDYDSSYIPEDLMWNVYLPPFKAALDAGVGSLMSAYMDLNDVPATGNHWLLHDVLRQDWNFNGFVVSDAQAIGSLVTHGYARDGSDAAYKGINAGVNMDMASFTYTQNLAKLVKEGKVSTAEIDAMVRPILAAKFRLGLFEHPYAPVNSEQVASNPHNAELARTAAQRSMVLLRNENSLLPLAKSGKYSSIAVIGPLADSGDDQLSMWGHIGKPNPPVSVLQGIRNKLGNSLKIEYSKGPNITREYPSFFADALHIHTDAKQTPEEAKKAFDDAVQTAKRNDLVVMVLGEGSIMNGEAASRASLDLVGQQEQLLEAVVATGKPVVLVLINARPVNLLWASEHVPAILEAWVPGDEGGNAVADILFGGAVPGGKLPITWPRTVGQIPIYYAHNLTQQHEDDPKFTSRYWDLSTSPLYPFGYGLSYTSFTYSNVKVSNPIPKVGDKFEVTADVENTGKVAGDTVAQLYVHQQAGSASRPVRQLQGFERITLAPGEKKTVHFTLGKDELSYWSPSLRKWVEEPEQFDVWVGDDSAAKLHSNFKLVSIARSSNSNRTPPAGAPGSRSSASRIRNSAQINCASYSALTCRIAGTRLSRTRLKMSRTVAAMILLLAALLEAGGDALIRVAIHRTGTGPESWRLGWVRWCYSRMGIRLMLRRGISDACLDCMSCSFSWSSRSCLGSSSTSCFASRPAGRLPNSEQRFTNLFPSISEFRTTDNKHVGRPCRGLSHVI